MYQSSKVIQGSFHQGSARFGNSSGKQCTCCSLFSIIFSLIKSPGYWTENDLDFIVTEGDSLYKKLNTNQYLFISDLPKEVCIFDSIVGIIFLENTFGLLSGGEISAGFIFKKPIPTHSNGFLFLMKELCVAVTWTKKLYILFDSHSRNSIGETCSDRTSTVFQFSTRQALEHHIKKNYLNISDRNIQFEVQYIQVKQDEIDIKHIRKSYRCRKSTLSGEKASSDLPTTVSKKFILGSFHQGSAKFGNSSGKQCTCCSLFSIIFSLIKTVGHWTKDDLDFIVCRGDLIYKDINIDDYLLVTDLPKEIALFDSKVEITYLENTFGFISGQSWFTDSIFKTPIPVNSNGFLFLTKGLCVSVTWTKKIYAIFDSHSRNSKGETCPDGTSTLFKFTTRKALEKHIVKNYIDVSDRNVQFEVQYVQINTTEKELINFRSTYHLFSARKLKLTELERDRCRKRKCTESEKDKCRQRNASKQYKKNAAERKQQSKEAGNRVMAFKNAAKEGPYFTCVVCNRTFYKKTVKVFEGQSYDPSFHQYNGLFTNTLSYDQCKYICKTCDRHLKKKQIPCQAVWNKLSIDEIPDQLKCLNRLEKILISKRILFKKISIMPKGQQPKIKGSVCNIPIQTQSVCNCLPRGSNEDGTLLVRLKRKIEFKGHVYFESVRPDFIMEALQHLKLTNPFYSHILINIDNINKELLCLSDLDSVVEQDKFSVTLENDEVDEEDVYRSNP